MSLCINPSCPQPNYLDNDKNRFCHNCGSQLELLGRYRIMRLLSDTTGFSKIYEAYQQGTPKIIKILREELNNDANAVSLFQQEVTVIKQLNHPGIPQTEGYFQYQTRAGLTLHCLVMEKIDNLNLEQWFNQQQHRPISEAQAIVWLKQLAEILALVHDQKYLHLNIQPANIMIRPNGQLALIDIGTTREMIKTSIAHGREIKAITSSAYSPPEPLNSQAIPQADFFSLGRTFVFLLTGSNPLDFYDPHLNNWQWRNHATHVSPPLLNFIDWLMFPEIDKLPSNAREILQRLVLVENENQITVNHAVTVNLKSDLETKQSPQNTINKTGTSQPHQPEKMPLLSLMLAMLLSLGLLGLVSLATSSSKFGLAANYGQAPEKKGKVDYFPYEEGKDSQGKIAEFNIAVLSVEYKWLLGSNFQIKHNDKIISLDLLRLNLEQEGIQKIMENPSEIISVGTASCEGSIAVEQRRSLERAKQIQLLGKKLFTKTPSVKSYRLLNLGQFQRKDCQANQDSTSYQRSIIIIGVRKQSEGVILDEALRNRLDKKPFADFKLKDYSLGSVDTFQTIPSNLVSIQLSAVSSQLKPGFRGFKLGRL